MNKVSEMEIQLITVGKSIITATASLFHTIAGKIVTLMLFLGSIGLAGIAPLIHITLGFVGVDMIFGIAVTIHKKGWNHILSSRLRDSLIKAFFYILIIIGLFLIETHLIDGYYITSKAVFALITGVEMWSILANMLILFPNFPVLKIFKKYMINEMSNKIGLSTDEITNILETNESN